MRTISEQGVTWLLPVRNGMPFLREALASVAAQTFRPFTVLVWDNASSDGTLEELDAWIPRRVPGRVIRDRPLPLGESLAALVELSETEFCARIDADDVAEPDRLAAQHGFITAHPRVGCVGSRFTAIDERSRECSLQYNIATEYAGLQDELLLHNAVSHPSVMFRRSAVRAAGNYRGVPDVEDYDLWLRVCAGHEVCSLPERLIRYRVHGKNISLNALREGRLDSALLEAWIANAGVFAGIGDAARARSVRLRKRSFVLPDLIAIARHLGRRDHIPWVRRFLAPGFRMFCQKSTARRDMLTRAALRALGHCPTEEVCVAVRTRRGGA